MEPRASEELLSAPLPQLIKELGLAVADANENLRSSSMVYTIDKAEIDLKIAISIDSSKTVGGKVDFGVQAFSVNASYSKTYGFKEEASSSIKLTLRAIPKNENKSTTTTEDTTTTTG